MADSPELKFVVTGDTSGLDAAIRRAKSGVGEMRTQLNAGAASFAKWGAAGAAAGAAMAIAITRNAAEAGKEIANLARISGTGVVEFQKLAAASNEVGIGQEKLGDIFKDLRDRVGDFIQTGGGPMVDFFERIAPQAGVTAEQFRKLSGPDALQLFVNTMEKAGLSSNEMAFQMEAMASDATALLPLLKDGGREMRALGDAAEKAGQVLSEIDVARLQQAAKDMAAFDRTIGTLKNQLGAELAPVLGGIGDLITQAANEAGGFGNLAQDVFSTVIDAAGFVADAIHGIKVVFQTVADGIIIGAGTMAAALTNPFEDMAAVMSMLPGSAGETFGRIHEEIKGFRDNAKGAVVEAMNAMGERLNEPLPSEGMKQWVEEQKTRFDEVAKKGQEAMMEATGGAGLGSFASEEDREAAQKAAEDHKKQLMERIERIRQANLTEVALEKERYTAEQEALREAREMGLEIKGGYDQAEREAKERHEQNLSDIEMRAADQRKRIAEDEARARQNAMAKMWSNLSSLMGSESRKMFEIGKAAAISQTVISTITGAQEAYKALAGIPVVGPALGAAAAAAATLAGAARVSQIRSQSFGGGGSVGAGAGGGAGAAGAAQTPGVGIQGQQEPTAQFNVTLQGDGAIPQSAVRGLFDQMNQAAGDGMRLNKVIFE